MDGANANSEHKYDSCEVKNSGDATLAKSQESVGFRFSIEILDWLDSFCFYFTQFGRKREYLRIVFTEKMYYQATNLKIQTGITYLFA